MKSSIKSFAVATIFFGSTLAAHAGVTGTDPHPSAVSAQGVTGTDPHPNSAAPVSVWSVIMTALGF